MDNERKAPLYDLFIDPLRRDPNLTSLIVQGIKCTLAGIFEEPFVIHDVSTALMEVLDNIYRHANWDSPYRPTLHVWLETIESVPYFTIMASNAVDASGGPEVRIRQVAECTRNRSTALLTVGKSLSEISPLSSKARREGGMGLLNVAALERCQMTICFSGDVFEIQVALAVPELAEQQLT